MTKLTIPQIREEVQNLTSESAVYARRQIQIAARIDALMQETYRRSYTRAPITSRRVTAAVRASVRKMAEDFPDMSHQDIATSHDINLGRVSEILHGKR